MMRVHHKTFYTGLKQMIKRMGDEGTMKNGDERLRELFRQRTQPLTEACAKNESLIHLAVLAAGKTWCKQEVCPR
jgi:hypothetical protein